MGNPTYSYDTWAIERSWTQFRDLARLVLAMPEMTLEDWATPEPIGSAPAYGSRVLARRLVDALVMVEQLLKDMREWDRAVWYAVKKYLLRDRKSKLLVRAKPFVYDWLLRAVGESASRV